MTDKNVDWEKVHTLLNTANLALKWPHLKHLHDLALEELSVIGKEKPEATLKEKPKEKLEEKPEAKPEATPVLRQPRQGDD